MPQSIKADWYWNAEDCPWNPNIEIYLNLNWALTCGNQKPEYLPITPGTNMDPSKKLHIEIPPAPSLGEEPRMLLSVRRTAYFLYGNFANEVLALWGFIWNSGSDLFRWIKNPSRFAVNYFQPQWEWYQPLGWWLELEWVRRMDEECYLDRKEKATTGNEKWLEEKENPDLWQTDNWRFGSRDNLCHTILVAFIGDTILNAFYYDPTNIKENMNLLNKSIQALKSNKSSQIFINNFLSKRKEKCQKLFGEINHIDFDKGFDDDTLREIIRTAWHIASIFHDVGYSLALLQVTSEGFWGGFESEETMPPIVKDYDDDNSLIGLIDKAKLVLASTPEFSNGKEKWKNLLENFNKLIINYGQMDDKLHVPIKQIYREDKKRFHEIWSCALIIHLMERGLNIMKNSRLAATDVETQRNWIIANLLASRAVLKHHNGEGKPWIFDEDPIGYLLRAVDDTQNAFRTLYGPGSNISTQDNLTTEEAFSGGENGMGIIPIINLYVPSVKIRLFVDDKGWRFLTLDRTEDGYRPPQVEYEEKRKNWESKEYNPMFESEDPALSFKVEFKFVQETRQ